MKKTVFSHFYNEEYLLPWWLMHHREIFDHGVMIDYDSTDSSLEIIKEYCPSWEIVTSRNREFDARLSNEEVIEYESKHSGWKMCLNITEFLVGDYSILNDIESQMLIVPCYIMVDTNLEENNNLSYSKSLVEQKPFGVPRVRENPKTIFRTCRAIHNSFTNYPLGRHYVESNCDKLKVFWYGYSPFTSQLMKRKLQIQSRIPESDKSAGYGKEHITTEQKEKEIFNNYLPLAVNLLKSE